MSDTKKGPDKVSDATGKVLNNESTTSSVVTPASKPAPSGGISVATPNVDQAAQSVRQATENKPKYQLPEIELTEEDIVKWDKYVKQKHPNIEPAGALTSISELAAMNPEQIREILISKFTNHAEELRAILPQLFNQKDPEDTLRTAVELVHLSNVPFIRTMMFYNKDGDYKPLMDSRAFEIEDHVAKVIFGDNERLKQNFQTKESYLDNLKFLAVVIFKGIEFLKTRPEPAIQQVLENAGISGDVVEGLKLPDITVDAMLAKLARETKEADSKLAPKQSGVAQPIATASGGVHQYDVKEKSATESSSKVAANTKTVASAPLKSHHVQKNL